MINQYGKKYSYYKCEHCKITYKEKEIEKELKELDKQLDRIKSVYIKGIMKIDEFENEIKQIEFKK